MAICHVAAFSQAWILENLESLYEQVPKRILPIEYGGNAGPIDKLGGT